MGKFLKIVLVLVILFMVVLVGAYFFINAKGNTIIASQIQAKLNPKVEIDSLKVIFPLTVKLGGVKIENFLDAEEISIQPSLISLLSGNVGFSKIALVNPKIIIVRAPSGSFNVNSLLKPSEGEAKPVAIGSIIVKNGAVNFVDNKVSSSGFTTRITDLDMNINNPLSPRFTISAKVQGQDASSTGLVDVNGWVSFLRKDMKTDFELSNLDGAYFSPYFSTFLADKKLKSAVVNSKINMTSDNNQVDGKCHLEIADIVYEEPQQDIPGESAEGSSGQSEAAEPKQITLDFPIKGTLVPFKINFVKITGSVFTEMLKDTITSEPEKIPEKIKAIGEKFKGLEKIFKE